MNWIKYFFSSPKFFFEFKFDDKKEYELKELIQLLKNTEMSVGTGNTIVLKILEELVKKHEK